LEFTMLQVRRFRPSQVVSRVLVVLALLTATHVVSAASITDNRYSYGQNDK
jgi:hypothetical protein